MGRWYGCWCSANVYFDIAVSNCKLAMDQGEGGLQFFLRGDGEECGFEVEVKRIESAVPFW